MLQSIIRSLLVLVALAACVGSLVSAWAISLAAKGTTASVVAAANLVPVNADYWSALGAVETDKSEAYWRKSLQLNPYNAELWARLGFYTESTKHDLPAAERLYLQAARFNHMYLPSWTLANFYFRYRNKPGFLASAKDALFKSPFNNSSLFFQAWSLTGDNRQVMALLPARHEVVFNYLNYLLESSQTDALEAAAMQALSLPRRVPADLLEAVPNWLNLVGVAEDTLLAAGQPEAALRVWTKTSQTGWNKLPAPSRSAPLTNGSFQTAFSNHGFDWSFMPTNGITFDQLTDRHEARFSFSGTQPEWCRLLQQFVPVAPGKAYQLQWQTDYADFEHAIGLTWKAYPVRFGRVDMESGIAGPDLVNESGGAQKWKFFNSADANFVLVTLEFKRPVGQARAEGTLSIHDVEMVPINDSAARITSERLLKNELSSLQ